jgi:hypothetical protein
MAKVTITIEDIVKDGGDGLRVSATSDPQFPDSEEDQSLAQSWALDIIGHIVDNASEVTEAQPTH